MNYNPLLLIDNLDLPRLIPHASPMRRWRRAIPPRTLIAIPIRQFPPLPRRRTNNLHHRRLGKGIGGCEPRVIDLLLLLHRHDLHPLGSVVLAETAAIAERVGRFLVAIAHAVAELFPRTRGARVVVLFFFLVIVVLVLVLSPISSWSVRSKILLVLVLVRVWVLLLMLKSRLHLSLVVVVLLLWWPGSSVLRLGNPMQQAVADSTTEQALSTPRAIGNEDRFSRDVVVSVVDE